jgi:potassium-transporting ATPase KdpC subunit
MLNEIRPALLVFAVLTVLTGVIYPAVTTLIGALAFGAQVNGSVIDVGGRAVGSRLIGQPFSGPNYFWSRPSATGPQPYNGAASSGSNQGPINPAFEMAVRDRIAALRAADTGNRTPIPVDLVTASASGLDPHISPAAAAYQVARVARERRVDPETVRALVRSHTEGRTFGVLGEPRVNVLELNLALDRSTAR